ncbi:transposase [Cobetia marina]
MCPLSLDQNTLKWTPEFGPGAKLDQTDQESLIMSRKRRQYSSEFKAQAALTALKGEQTMSEISAHFEIHPIMVSQWKCDLLDNATGVFEGMSSSKTAQKTHPEPPLPSKAGYGKNRYPTAPAFRLRKGWRHHVGRATSFLSIAVQVYSISRGEETRQ